MLIRQPAPSAIAVFGITVAVAIAATMLTVIGEQLSPTDLPLPQRDRVVVLQKWDSANSQLKPLVPQGVVTWREQLWTA